MESNSGSLQSGNTDVLLDDLAELLPQEIVDAYTFFDQLLEQIKEAKQTFDEIRQLATWKFNPESPEDRKQVLEALVGAAKELGLDFDQLAEEFTRITPIKNLEVQLNREAGSFLFLCELDLTLNDEKSASEQPPQSLTLSIEITKTENGQYHSKIGGALELNGYRFALIFDHTAGTSRFVATYTHAPGQGSVKTHNILKDTGLEALIPNIEIDLKHAFLAYQGTSTEKKTVVGFAISATADLTALPLAKEFLQQNAQGEIEDLHLLVSTHQLGSPECESFITLLKHGGIELFAPNADRSGLSLNKGCTLNMKPLSAFISDLKLICLIAILPQEVVEAYAIFDQLIEQIKNAKQTLDEIKQLAAWRFNPASPAERKQVVEALVGAAKCLGLDLSHLVEEFTQCMPIKKLEVELDRKAGSFLFLCELEFDLTEQGSEPGTNPLNLTVSIQTRKADQGGYHHTFGGKLDINGYPFTLIFDRASGTSRFVATYSHAPGKGSLKTHDILKNTGLETLVPDLEIDLKLAFLAFQRTAKERKVIFGFAVSATVDLSSIPLVGEFIPKDARAGFEDLRLLVSSHPLDAKECGAFITLLKEGGVELVAPDADLAKLSLRKGSTFNMKLMLAGIPDPAPVVLPLDHAKPQGAASSGSGAEETADTSDDVMWFPIQKRLGPIHFMRVGATMRDYAIWIPLDVSLGVAVVELSLYGLSVGFPLLALADMKYFTPEIDLQGIGLKIDRNPMKLDIQLLRTSSETDGGEQITEYSGSGKLELGAIALSVMGIYRDSPNAASVFIYGRVGFMPIGPPVFMVSGFSAGVGYNRELIAPPVEKVRIFPLVQDAMDSAVGDTSKDQVSGMLQRLTQHVVHHNEQYFVAGGLSFTVCKLIDGFALVVFTFGQRFRFNLLGAACLSLPPKALGLPITLISVELVIKATVDPSEGVIEVRGMLTDNSYVLTTACKLYGGFAFCLWFAGENAGDFVLTLGGYHPSFQAPKHYPQVPRVGAHIDLLILDIKGEIYFALTGRGIMAGGMFQATLGMEGLRAWFALGADFLISWQPLFFEVGVLARVGGEVAFLSAEISTDVRLWGPNFGGHVAFELLFFEIDIQFGAPYPGSKPKTITWAEFKKSYLPDPDKVCTLAAKTGLLGTLKQEKQERWIFGPNKFEITTRSLIPVKDAKTSAPPFSVAPMGGKEHLGELTSNYHLTIVHESRKEDVTTEFDAVPIQQNFPAALWSEVQPNPNDINGERIIENLVTGITIKGKPATPNRTKTVERKQLCFKPDNHKSPWKWSRVPHYQHSQAAISQETQIQSITETSDSTFTKRKELAQQYGFDLELSNTPYATADFLKAPGMGKREAVS